MAFSGSTKPSPKKGPTATGAGGFLRPDDNKLAASSALMRSQAGGGSGAVDASTVGGRNALAQSTAPRAAGQRATRAARPGQRVSSSHKKSVLSPEAEISAQLQNRMPKPLGPSAVGGLGAAGLSELEFGFAAGAGAGTEPGTARGSQVAGDRSAMRSALSAHSGDDVTGSSAGESGAGGGGGGWLGAGLRPDKALRYGIGMRSTGVGADGKALDDPFAPKEWTQEELQEKITIRIEETDTMMLLHIPSVKVWGEDEDLAARVARRNDEYDAVVDRHRERDKFVARSAQTFNHTVRHKKLKAWPALQKDVRLQATSWDIYDAFEQNNAAANALIEAQRKDDDADAMARAGRAGAAAAAAYDRDDGTGSGAQPPIPSGPGAAAASLHSSMLSSGSGSAASQSQATGGTGAGGFGFSRVSRSDDGGSAAASTAGGAGQSGATPTRLVMHRGGGPGQSALEVLSKSKSFVQALQMLEQAVVQNAIHEKQVLYRAPELAAAAAHAAAAHAAAHHQHTGSHSHGRGHHPGAHSQANGGAGLHSSGSGMLGVSGSRPGVVGEEGGVGAGTGAGVGGDGLDRKSGDIKHSGSKADLFGDGGAASAHGEAYDSVSGLGGANGIGGGNGVLDASGKPKRYLLPLWSFSCPATKGLAVTCLDWNRKNHDLMVAGYGRTDFGNSSHGLVLFWSLKNPDYPQKVYRTKHSVTSIDCCADRPNLLAVGMYDGTVAIYDVTKDTDKPSLESVHKPLDSSNANSASASAEFGKHSEPVWGLKWVNMGKAEQDLTSVSSDGTVRVWSTKKGLVPTTLMRLTRIPNRAQSQSAHMEGVSREASGLCFDFPPSDGTQYYCGTEDGLIHKCSVSYNAQTLENYYGHTGPVYRVRCSPFSPDAFLSCSADWSIKLWTQLNTAPVLNFASGQDYVTDVQWSPTNSCVFGSVNRDGRVEVWNLGDKNPFDPAIKHFATAAPVPGSGSGAGSGSGSGSGAGGADGDVDFGARKHLTCLTFSHNAPVILTGADDGTIDCYRICGLLDRKDGGGPLPHAHAHGAAPGTAAAAAHGKDKKSSDPPQTASGAGPARGRLGTSQPPQTAHSTTGGLHGLHGLDVGGGLTAEEQAAHNAREEERREAAHRAAAHKERETQDLQEALFRLLDPKTR